MQKLYLKKMKFFYFLPCIIIFFFIVLFYPKPDVFADKDKITLYFYSSETNINNFKSLKMEFDKYLSKFGYYEFQPFSDRHTFEQHIRGKTNCLIFMSSWHYNKIHQSHSLYPLLTGLKKGSKYQKRILVASSNSSQIDAIKKGPVASSSNETFTRSVLGEMLDKPEAVKSVRILTVPKDIDALMSVGFAMSKSALITENTLDTLKTTDPVLYKKMKTLAVGKKSLRMIVAVPENFVKQAKEISKLIQNMPNNSNGMDIIKMLDLDGWEILEPSNMKQEG